MDENVCFLQTWVRPIGQGRHVAPCIQVRVLHPVKLINLEYLDFHLFKNSILLNKKKIIEILIY